MKKLARLLLLVLVSPLLLALVAVATGCVLCLALYNWLWLRWFCWTRADRLYLICSRRRGWEPFLKNNAIPALPSRITAVWIESPQPLANVIHAMGVAQVRHPRPFIIHVTVFGIMSVPLNQRLQSLKPFGKRSPIVGANVRLIYDAVLRDFVTPCDQTNGS